MNSLQNIKSWLNLSHTDRPLSICKWVIRLQHTAVSIRGKVISEEWICNSQLKTSAKFITLFQNLSWFCMSSSQIREKVKIHDKKWQRKQDLHPKNMAWTIQSQLKQTSLQCKAVGILDNLWEGLEEGGQVSTIHNPVICRNIHLKFVSHS